MDAKSGEIRWQNNSSGHLSPELRKGVSVQGNMTILGDQLLLAGGNQVSPAPFDINTGELRAKPFAQGQPKANNGQFVGVFQNKLAIVGGRILHSAPENVATKGSFVGFTDKGRFTMNFGGVPPAWDDQTVALVNFKHGKLTCLETESAVELLESPPAPTRGDSPAGARARALSEPTRCLARDRRVPLGHESGGTQQVRSRLLGRLSKRGRSGGAPAGKGSLTADVVYRRSRR